MAGGRFALDPDFASAIEDDAARDRAVRRETTNPDEVAEIRTLIDEGSAPEDVSALVGVVAEFAACGVSLSAVDAFRGRFLEPKNAPANWHEGAPAAHGATWRAILETAFEVGKPAEEAVDLGAPQIDLDAVFAGSPTVAAQCREVAARLKTSTDGPAMVALTVASAALAARVDGEVQYPGGATWRHPLSLHLAVEVPSGGGKSAMLSLMGNKVLARRETDIVEAARIRVEDALIQREIVKAEQSRLMGILKKSGDDPAIRAQVRDLNAQLAQPLPTLPYFRVADATPQHFTKMGLATGFVFLAAGEGQVILRKFAAPEQSNVGDQWDSWLSAYTGEDYLRGRVKDDGARPNFTGFRAVTLLLLQPGLLSPRTPIEGRLLENMAARGVLARLLIARPRRLTRREVQEMPGPTDKADATQRRYDAMIGFLAHWRSNPDPLSPREPAVMSWAHDANAAALEYQERMKAEAEAGGSWHEGLGREEFARRSGENVIRLAEVLRALRAAEDVTAGENTPADLTVEREDFDRALALFEGYFVPNALAAFARATFDAISDDADRVLGIMRELGTCVLSDLQRRLGRGWGKSRAGDKVSRLEAALEPLEQRGIIAIDRLRRRGGGRRIRFVAAMG